MRFVRYLFLLLLAVVMTTVLAGHARAAVETNNETTPVSNQGTVPGSTKSSNVVEVQESSTKETAATTSSHIDGTGSVDTNTPAKSTVSAPESQTAPDLQNSSSAVLAAPTTNLTAPKIEISRPSHVPSGYGYQSQFRASYSENSSGITTQPANVSNHTNSPVPSPSNNVPVSNAVWLTLASVLRPVLNSVGSGFVPLAILGSISYTWPSVILLIGMLVSLVVISGWLMQLRKQGFALSARGADVRTNSFAIFSVWRAIVNDIGSLFYSGKTNVTVLTGGVK